MNHSEFQTLQTHLRNRIDELEALVAQSGDPADGKSAPNPDAVPETELGLKLAEKDRQELARLRDNLVWLASEKGGCCVKCGCEIPIARLRVVPATRLCVNCAAS